MNKDLWNELDKKRAQGFRINLETLISILHEKDINFVKDDVLSVLTNSYQDGGYYTPNNIAELMVKLGKINNPKKIIDICCGIGNILTYCDYGKEIEGVDINQNALQLAKLINPQVEFKLEDIFKLELVNKYDLVFSDFPFGGRIKKHGKIFTTEELFIEKGLSLLNKNGVLITLVPQGFLYNPRYQLLRNHILQNYNLEFIIYLPNNMLPHTTIRSAILYIRNSGMTDKTMLEEFQNNTKEILQLFLEKKCQLIKNRKDLKERWDYEFHTTDYTEIEKELSKYETRTIGEMAKVINGYSVKKEERKRRGHFLVIGGKNITNNRFQRTPKDCFINFLDKPGFKRAILQPGDIIISTLFSKRKIYVYKKIDPKAIVNNSCAVIRSPDNEYIATYLQTIEGIDLFTKQAEKAVIGGFIPRLSSASISNIKIPIIPIEKLEMVSNQYIEESSSDELLQLQNEVEKLKSELNKEKIKNQELELFYENRLEKITEQRSTNELLQKIKGGESKRLEFKSTLRYGIKSKQQPDRKVQFAALKSIAGLCNAEGGKLLIGVADDGKILGIELDKFPNNDKFALHLFDLLKKHINIEISHYVDTEFIKISGKIVCRVKCQKGKEDAWLSDFTSNGEDKFFVRDGPRTSQYPGPKAVKYIAQRFLQNN